MNTPNYPLGTPLTPANHHNHYMHCPALTHLSPANHHNHYIHRPALTQLTPANHHNHYMHCPALTHLSSTNHHYHYHHHPALIQLNTPHNIRHSQSLYLHQPTVHITTALSLSLSHCPPPPYPNDRQSLTADIPTECTNSSVQFCSNLAARSASHHSKLVLTVLNIQPVTFDDSMQ